MEKNYIPDATLGRLPRYYRCFCELKENGVGKSASQMLSIKTGLTASQIRQDFSRFGSLGQHGYGYNVEQVCHDLGKLIGTSHRRRAILIGAGNLGRSVILGAQFAMSGFQLVAVFDRKESFVGQIIRNIPVRHIDGLDEFCRENFPQMAVLCIPANEAAEIYPQLVKLGITGFWNFSGYELPYRDGVVSTEVFLGDSLNLLCYKMNTSEK